MQADTHIGIRDVRCVETSGEMNSRRVDGLTFRNGQGHGFKLAAAVVQQLRSYAQVESGSREAGGVLLGRYLLDTNDVVVDLITTPTRSDKRLRFGYFRAREGHQELVDQAWRESKGACHYLGEWHTHPEACPVPSGIDRVNWKRILSHYRADADPLYFVIVGQIVICAWQGHKQPVRLERLTLTAGGEG